MYRYLIEENTDSIVLMRDSILPGFDGKLLDMQSYKIIAEEIGWPLERVAASTVELLTA